jgi:ribonuclease HI
MVTERNEKGKKCSKLVEVKNVDLWKELYDLYKYHTIETVWVRGHNGHPENEWCDQAAGEAVDRLKNAGLAIQ